MSHILLLASQSIQRKQFLEQIQIPFIIISQDANERECDWGLPLPKLLESIALHKMNHVVMPNGQEGDEKFVLTTDTMIQDGHGTIYGKPENKENAIAMIKAMRNDPGEVGSAFCIDKKKYTNGSWIVEQRIVRYVSAGYIIDIPDHWIEIYFENYPDYLKIAGSLTIEGFALQFLKSLHGSYGTALGLPVYELRESLESLGFFTQK